MRKRIITTAAVLAAAALGATASVASADGRLVQLPDPFDCIADADTACADGSNMTGLRGQAISPDGRHLYAVAGMADAILTFDRDPGTGRLTQRAECIGETAAGGCADGEALGSPRDLAISADGSSVYVASGNGVAVLDRDPATGTLTQKSGTDGCVSATGGACETGLGLGLPRSVTVSADGTSVYVGAATNRVVAIFDRASDGRLEQKAGTNGCITDAALAGCASGLALNDIRSLVVSPDGTSVYAAALGSQAVVRFDRAPNGNLNQASCYRQGGLGCTPGNLLYRPRALAISPDGQDLYVASWTGGGDPTGVAVFDRAVDGALSQPPAPSTAGCVEQAGIPEDPACQQAIGLFAASDVAVSPDGRNVYVATQNGAAVFDRAANGALSQRPQPEGCLNDVAMPAIAGCGPATAVLAAVSVAIAPEGDNVYLGSEIAGTIAAFDRDASPVCRDVRRTALHATAREIPLDCSDPNGDPLTYTVISGPSHGTLSAPGATMTYTPAAGFVGIDTFVVQATGNGAASNVATVTVEVLPPAPGAGADERVVERTILIASFKSGGHRSKRKRAFKVGFVSTAPARATLDVLNRRGKRIVRVSGQAVAGAANALRITKAKAKRLKPGRYTLRLTLNGGDGQVSADTAKLRVVKR